MAEEKPDTSALALWLAYVLVRQLALVADETSATHDAELVIPARGTVEKVCFEGVLKRSR
jgi:hypothetical protein